MSNELYYIEDIAKYRKSLTYVLLHICSNFSPYNISPK